MSVSAAERLARAGLTRRTQPGDPQVARRVELAGAVAVWDALATPAEREQAERDLARAGQLGVRLACPGDEEWPPQLADCDRIRGAGPLARGAAPLALWLTGPLALRETCERSVAVVGSRAASGYGEHVAGELAAGLAERGFTVVSGAAYGIDGAAHRGALAAGGDTVAVLAGGLDHVYPAGHATLLARIRAEGLLAAEVPPGCVPTRVRFLSRNRVIAALTRGTVLVEAGVRSGGRNTLAYARALGRGRLVVPGPVTSAGSAGCHLELQRDPGARLVTSAAEVAAEVGSLDRDPDPAPAGPGGPRDGLDLLSAQVLDAVPVSAAVSAERIALAAGTATGAALAALRRLAAAGLVEQLATGFRLTPLAREPTAGG